MKTKEMKRAKGNSSEVRRLGFQAFSAGCAGSFPGGELRLSFPHAAQHGQKNTRAEINEIETIKIIKRLTILRAGFVQR